MIDHRDPAYTGQLAAARAAGLADSIRSHGAAAVTEATDRLERPQLVALVAALAAMIPAGADPAVALEWVEVPASRWSTATLAAEYARREAGADDPTARAAERVMRQRIAEAEADEANRARHGITEVAA